MKKGRIINIYLCVYVMSFFHKCVYICYVPFHNVSLFIMRAWIHALMHARDVCQERIAHASLWTNYFCFLNPNLQKHSYLQNHGFEWTKPQMVYDLPQNFWIQFGLSIWKITFMIFLIPSPTLYNMLYEFPIKKCSFRASLSLIKIFRSCSPNPCTSWRNGSTFVIFQFTRNPR